MRTRQRIISIAAACVTLIAMATTASATSPGESLPPTRIIGGNEANPGEYPFVVAVVERHEPSAWHGALCSGTVVTSNWVLTAASCVADQRPSHLDIVVGRHDLTTDEGIRIPVTEIVVHPLFDLGSPTHDAALLWVTEPLGVDPIRLPSTTGQPPAGTGAVVTGWGDTNTEARYPRRLHHVEVSVVDDDVCLETYGAEYDTRFMMCAGDLEEGGVDACDGDEGGPLLVGSDGSWTQVGIDSWGLGCGLPGYPGVYTEIGSMLGWIQNTSRIQMLTCDGEKATIVGTEASDIIVGTEGDDVIVALGARDIIDGRGGNDLICAGAGRDRIVGGSGADTIFGGTGNDTIYGGAGDDLLYGESGNDRIRGEDGRNYLDGGEGSDDLRGGDGVDHILGGTGNDRIDGQDGPDVIDGGGGNDTLAGGSGDDTLAGDLGTDVIDGGPGNDTINGERGDDHIEGGMGEDALFGGPGDDSIEGGDGDDTIDGGPDDDTIQGDAGDDSISGGSGNDSIEGGVGNDELTGSTGNDTVLGNLGADIIMGENGIDLLEGGDGADTINGGRGPDVLRGGAANDALVGGLGNDTLIGGDALDFAHGGKGVDTCDAERMTACEIDGGGGVDPDGVRP